MNIYQLKVILICGIFTIVLANPDAQITNMYEMNLGDDCEPVHFTKFDGGLNNLYNIYNTNKSNEDSLSARIKGFNCRKWNIRESNGIFYATVHIHLHKKLTEVDTKVKGLVFENPSSRFLDVYGEIPIDNLPELAAHENVKRVELERKTYMANNILNHTSFIPPPSFYSSFTGKLFLHNALKEEIPVYICIEMQVNDFSSENTILSGRDSMFSMMVDVKDSVCFRFDGLKKGKYRVIIGFEEGDSIDVVTEYFVIDWGEDRNYKFIISPGFDNISLEKINETTGGNCENTLDISKSQK